MQVRAHSVNAEYLRKARALDARWYPNSAYESTWQPNRSKCHEANEDEIGDDGEHDRGNGGKYLGIWFKHLFDVELEDTTFTVEHDIVGTISNGA